MSFINIKFNAFISKNLGKRLLEYYKNNPNLDIAINKESFLTMLKEELGYWLPEPFSNTNYAETDNRLFGENGSHRLQLSASINTNAIGSSDFFSPDEDYLKGNVGTSSQYVIKFVNNMFQYSDDSQTAPISEGIESVYPSIKTFYTSASPNTPAYISSVNIQKSVSAGYPFTAVSPSIDMTFAINLFKYQNEVKCYLRGVHNLFPCYEIIINNKMIYRYDPVNYGYTGPTPINLSKSKSFNKEVVILL